jgi:hypothetical protein
MLCPTVMWLVITTMAEIEVRAELVLGRYGCGGCKKGEEDVVEAVAVSECIAAMVADDALSRQTSCSLFLASVSRPSSCGLSSSSSCGLGSVSAQSCLHYSSCVHVILDLDSQ